MCKALILKGISHPVSGSDLSDGPNEEEPTCCAVGQNASISGFS